MKQPCLRGVNLGGWLVLERWMTPSLFEGVEAEDEWSFMQTEGASEKLRRHRETFITEADFAWIAVQGLDVVRLPVGYWIMQSDEPYEEGLRYVDWAYEMAEKYNLKVLLDLHAAPGSQNGHDHGGRRGRAEWFRDASARARTVEVVAALHARYRTSPSYWGIELLNEPKFGLFQWKLRRFYRTAARRLDGDSHVVFHDAFTPRLLSGALGSDPRAMMDIHLYHMTSWIARVVPVECFVRISGWWYERLLRRVRRRQPVIVGEWSVVLRGEALRHLDTATAHALMRQFGAAQLAVYERYCAAWFYWNYKTEKPGIWNFRSLIEDDFLVLPSPRG